MKGEEWFKVKKDGWGWIPTSPEGWQLLLFYILFLVWDFLRLNAVSHSATEMIRPFLIHMILASITLVAISYWKGERPTGN